MSLGGELSESMIAKNTFSLWTDTTLFPPIEKFPKNFLLLVKGEHISRESEKLFLILHSTQAVWLYEKNATRRRNKFFTLYTHNFPSLGWDVPKFSLFSYISTQHFFYVHAISQISCCHYTTTTSRYSISRHYLSLHLSISITATTTVEWQRDKIIDEETTNASRRTIHILKINGVVCI